MSSELQLPFRTTDLWFPEAAGEGRGGRDSLILGIISEQYGLVMLSKSLIPLKSNNSQVFEKQYQAASL